jgi:Bacterial type II and III secretion system protein
MRKIPFIGSLLLLALAVVLQPACAQEAPKANEAAKAADTTPVAFYRLLFVVQELGEDNKPVNSRAYTTTVSTNTPGSIRTGSRIPVATGNNQFQYVDVGVNVDIRHVTEIHHQLSLELTAEVSSLAGAYDPNVHQPVIRQNSWHASVLIPLGKATTIFASDALDNKGSIQVVITAQPLQ